jgi:outer membrane protein assembly factor BamB
MDNKKIVYIAMVLFLTSSIIPNGVNGSDNTKNTSNSSINYYGKGFRYNIQGWIYVHIEGEPYERGYQYGYLASEEIIDMIYRWSNFGHGIDFMKKLVRKNQPDNYYKLSELWWKICRTKSMKSYFKVTPNEYIQEIKGITDGIKEKKGRIFGREIEFEDVFAAQYVQECMLSIKNLKYRFHPFHGIFSISKLRTLIKMFKNSIVKKDISKEIAHLGHCSAFIATGDATRDGGIVVGHSTYFNNYIAQRCNIILDVKPSRGHRFVMTGPPGSLWSQEDFYINEKGIVLTETEYAVKGPWKKGVPKGVRSRKAIQESDNIDDVIKILQDGNDGLIPNEWLIGDIKTGEIASLEQVLFNTPVKRTFNGFYSSYVIPHNPKVQRELYGIVSFMPRLLNLLQSIYAGGRDKKFQELEKQYYGKIDAEVAKKILGTQPISNGMTDSKITTSKLMEHMGISLIMGNPSGIIYKPTDEIKKKYHGITELPVCGWVEVFPAISKNNNLHKLVDYDKVIKKEKLVWNYKTKIQNVKSIKYLVSDDILYISPSKDSNFALDLKNGKEIWNIKIEDEVFDFELSDKQIFIGTENGIYAIDKKTGDINWFHQIGEINSKPVIVDNIVIAGVSDIGLYAFDIDTGTIEWHLNNLNQETISEVYQNNICICSDNKCYCYDIKNNEIKWEFSSDGKITNPPSFNGNTVYVGCWDGNLYAIDLFNGEIKWTFKTGWGIDTTPAISDGIVFTGSADNNFYALDEKSGILLWYYTCKSAIHSSPVVYGEYVFFGSDDGRLYALDKISGEQIWNYAPEYSINNGDINNYITTPILSDPIIQNNVVYISANGSIYALDTQTIQIKKEANMEKSFLNDKEMILAFYLLFFFGIITLGYVYYKMKRQKKEKKLLNIDKLINGDIYKKENKF